MIAVLVLLGIIVAGAFVGTGLVVLHDAPVIRPYRHGYDSRNPQ
jgi:hypothetical protein